MNLVPSIQTLTMSSLEISGLVDSRHDKVKQSIERLADRGVISLPPMGEVKVQRERRDETVQVYNLCKRDSLIVVAQLCPEFTAKIVDRWQDLETKVGQQVAAIPQTLPEALRLAADLAEQKDRIAAQLAIAAPKLEAFDRIAEADGCLGLQEAGKALQQKPNKFIAWLREKGWIYRRAGSKNNLGHSEKVNAGYVTHKVTTVQREDGSEKVVEQALITPKGLARLAILLNVKPSSGTDMIGGAA